MPPFDWQKVIARFDEIIRLFSSTSILLPKTTCWRLMMARMIRPFGANFQGESLRRGSSLGLEDWLALGTHPSSRPAYQSSLSYSRRIQEHSNLLLDRMRRLMIEIVPGLPYPKAITVSNMGRTTKPEVETVPASSPADRPPEPLL
jgi:hypothetical protein